MLLRPSTHPPAWSGGAHRGRAGAEACLAVAALGFLMQAVVIVTSPVLGLARQPAMAA